ncbi:nicotinic acid mononucleotide adenyltransferase [Dokdonia sp. Hel_I_53]|uniref:nicotinic acid mononucleotide adenyltransferase n=1 Tax=Dokdonia sp. Hel_I_53 TaxID=1566287 RepID=UPI001199D5B1|nr:nicotinic acid mononucleotide adenyltransferase [Dokdonia sp. Hel_I_53]TVZ52303.1 hypothetical protein OD90_1475 [Dokdonia sp. Hel_I_53]
MKKILIIAAAFLVNIAVSAQEEVKNTYIQNGDIIEATLMHDNGTVSQTGFFNKKGQLTGKWISYDRTGNKTAEAQYEAGEKVGTWFFWADDKLTEVDYNNSRIAVVNTWKNKNTEVVSNRY